jgi:hypothetical protein
MPNSAFPLPEHDQSRAVSTQQSSIPIFAGEIAGRLRGALPFRATTSKPKPRI